MAPQSKRTYSCSSNASSLSLVGESPSVPSPSYSSDSAIDSCGGSPPPERERASYGRKRKTVDKESDQYKARRERNNEAVRKSRLKSKVKRDMMDTKYRELLDEKNKLAQENAKLVLKNETLEKELQLIRSWVNPAESSAPELYIFPSASPPAKF